MKVVVSHKMIIHFAMEMETLIITWGQALSYIWGSYQLLKMAQFISGRMSHIMLRSCWCEIIVLNVHAQTDDKK